MTDSPVAGSATAGCIRHQTDTVAKGSERTEAVQSLIFEPSDVIFDSLRDKIRITTERGAESVTYDSSSDEPAEMSKMRLSHRLTSRTVGYNYVETFDTPGCRKTSRDCNRQFQESALGIGNADGVIRTEPVDRVVASEERTHGPVSESVLCRAVSLLEAVTDHRKDK